MYVIEVNRQDVDKFLSFLYALLSALTLCETSIDGSQNNYRKDLIFLFFDETSRKHIGSRVQISVHQTTSSTLKMNGRNITNIERRYAIVDTHKGNKLIKKILIFDLKMNFLKRKKGKK